VATNKEFLREVQDKVKDLKPDEKERIKVVLCDRFEETPVS